MLSSHLKDLPCQANSDFQSNQQFNSEFEVKHSISSNLTWNKELFAGNVSTIALAYTGRSGRHYSPYNANIW